MISLAENLVERCQCRLPKQEVIAQSGKMLAAGETDHEP